jgi:hypothetical protein
MRPPLHRRTVTYYYVIGQWSNVTL